jgi:hypothetical protein
MKMADGNSTTAESSFSLNTDFENTSGTVFSLVHQTRVNTTKGEIYV